jgi:DNA-directed RNA polymerase alpha subunit
MNETEWKEHLEKKRKIYYFWEKYNLSVRTINILINKGIYTIEQLQSYSENDLLRFQGFGRCSLTEIRNLMRLVSEKTEKYISCPSLWGKYSRLP